MSKHRICSRNRHFSNKNMHLICTQLYKGFIWFTAWFWPIRFDFTTDLNGDSGWSGLTLQLFAMETIVKSNLISQNNPINQWKCLIGCLWYTCSQTCFVWPLIEEPLCTLKTGDSFMPFKSNTESSNRRFLYYFWSTLSYHLS